MARAIILDSFPLSCMGKSKEKIPTETDFCREWVFSCAASGNKIYVPEICYYETLRELERRFAVVQIQKLRTFCHAEIDRFIPINSQHIDEAARLWGQVRNQGKTTAGNDDLDGDMILIAQALSLNIPVSSLVIATTNVAHIGIFAPAEEWRSIIPGS
jgi:predicted nucleic acid-binding protein